METGTLRKGVALALAATGVLHLILTPEYAEKQAYLGVLFAAGGLAALGLAWAIWTRTDNSALVLGALISIGMGAGFILSRTVGLPGFQEGEWELSGLISLVLESFVAIGAAQLMRSRGSREVLAGT